MQIIPRSDRKEPGLGLVARTVGDGIEDGFERVKREEFGKWEQ